MIKLNELLYSLPHSFKITIYLNETIERYENTLQALYMHNIDTRYCIFKFISNDHIKIEVIKK